MNHYIPALFALLLIVSCQEVETPPAPAPSAPQVKPSDCNGASGAFWSTLRQDCVSLFRESPKLQPVHPDAKQHGSVFAIFNADSSQVEVWMPFERFTRVMPREGGRTARVWGDERGQLRCEGLCQYEEAGQVLYREKGKGE